MIAYLETSAAAKLITTEPETPALEGFLAGLGSDDLVVSGLLLETELRRVTVRESLPQETASAVLSGVRVLEMGRQVFHAAGLLPGPALRSLGALHPATALLEDVDALVTYDQRLAAAAVTVGVFVLSPN